MRSARLFALVMALPRHGVVTADELAERLEVSVRTIYRDVRSLHEAGVPVRTVTGPEGGIGLVAGWRSPVDALTTDEARALFIGGPGADLGLGAVLATARSKVRSGLPPAVRSRIDAVADRFLLDTSGWFHDADAGEHLEDVAAAVWSSRRLDLRYARGGQVVRRRVDPLGLVLKAGRWYLVAAHRRSPQTYRVDRIVAVATLDEPAPRPEGFDLDGYWRQAAVDFGADLHQTPARIRLPRAAIPVLRSAVPGPVTARAVAAALADADGSDDGLVTIDLAVESEEVALAQFIGVPDLEVLDPPTLRTALAERADRIARLNAR